MTLSGGPGLTTAGLRLPKQGEPSSSRGKRRGLAPLGAGFSLGTLVLCSCLTASTAEMPWPSSTDGVPTTAATAAAAATATTATTTATATTTTTTPTTTRVAASELSVAATRAALQAEMMLQDGDVPGALQELRSAVLHDDQSPYLRVRLGEALLLLGDAEGADTAADQSLSLAVSPPYWGAALRLKATARDLLGDRGGSIKALRQALQRGPDRQASAMLAERLVAAGELAAAEDVVTHWMEAEPGAVDGWVALGRVFAERAEIDRAFIHLRHALSLKPDDENALLSLRDLLLALGRDDEAAAAATAFAAAHGDEPEVRVMMLASIALKSPADARALAKSWLDYDGGDDTLRLVADGFERAGLLDDALQTLAAAPAPRSLISLEIARLLLSKRRPVEAEKIACAFAARPGALEERLQEFSITLCARAEVDRGEVDDAVLRLIEASSARPRSPRLIDALRTVVVRAQPSRQAAARQHAERVLAGLHTEADVLIAAAMVIDGAGDHAGATAVLTQALAKRPADRALVFAWSRLLANQGRAFPEGQSEARAAVEQVERLVESSGADVDTLNFMAFTLSEHQLRASAASAYAWRAVLLDPLNGYVHDTLGWALLMEGEIDEATASLRRAVRLSPDEGEIMFHLATALARQKHRGDALSTLARARALLPNSDPLVVRLDALKLDLQRP